MWKQCKPRQNVGFDPVRRGDMEKEQMIEQITALLLKLYYEDVEFFFGMIAKFAAKKGII